MDDHEVDRRSHTIQSQILMSVYIVLHFSTLLDEQMLARLLLYRRAMTATALGSETMTLADVIQQIDQLDDGLCIYATPRWRAESPVLVAQEPRDGGLPAGAKGMTYLISLRQARRAIAARSAWCPEQELNIRDRCKAVIYYAVYDAPEPRPQAAYTEIELSIAI